MTRKQYIVFFTCVLLGIGFSVREIVGGYRTTGEVPWLEVTNTVLWLSFLPFYFMADRRRKADLNVVESQGKGKG